MLGHRPGRRNSDGRASAAGSVLQSSFLQLGPSRVLAEAMDWRQQLNATLPPKDQGACGSCWAVASAGALEAHALSVSSLAQEVSYEQLVDCVPNPDQCGGQGGCKGATAELAFQYVQKHGLVARSGYQGYQSGGEDGKCKEATGSVLLTTEGFVRLPENKVQPLLEAVAIHGPVAVSADASNWGFYQSGVFDSCEKDAVVNHAILMMGYGRDASAKMDYFLIRNSWGSEWGERGYIRLLRHSEDNAYCGTDKNPLAGMGCKGGVSEIEVCGMCGVLSDSSYPVGVKLVQK